MKFRRRTPPGYPVRPDYEGRAGPPGSDPSIGAVVELGPRGGVRAASLPTPEEIRAFSEHFNLPWHEFQPRWAERLYVNRNPIILNPAGGVASPRINIAPAGQGRVVVVREFRLFIRKAIATDDDPRNTIIAMAMNVSLGQIDGRRPYRFEASSGQQIDLPPFVSGSYPDVVGASNFQTMLVQVPLLVIGDRDGNIIIEVTSGAPTATHPTTRAFVTGWELLLPDEYARAAL